MHEYLVTGDILIIVVIDVRYSYVVLALFLLLVWVGFAWLIPAYRKQMFVISIVGIFSAVSELLFIPDYWQPPAIWALQMGQSYISIEDLIFGFSFVGLASALPVFMNRSYVAPHAISWINLFKVTCSGVAVLGLAALLWMSGINSIYATAIAALIASAAILLAERNRTAVLQSLVGGSVMAMIMFLLYLSGSLFVSNFQEILASIWTLYGTPWGVQFIGVPLTEIVWAFCIGSNFALVFSKYRV